MLWAQSTTEDYIRAENKLQFYLLVIHYTNCKTFNNNKLNSSLKTPNTKISLTHFTFYKTYQSLARNQKLFPESGSERVNAKISLRFFFSFLISKLTLKIPVMGWMNYKDCDFYCTVTTTRETQLRQQTFNHCTSTITQPLILSANIQPLYIHNHTAPNFVSKHSLSQVKMKQQQQKNLPNVFYHA